LSEELANEEVGGYLTDEADCKRVPEDRRVNGS
jgi:hypothetical protein